MKTLQWRSSLYEATHSYTYKHTICNTSTTRQQNTANIKCTTWIFPPIIYSIPLAVPQINKAEEKYKLCHRVADQWLIFPFIILNVFLCYLSRSKVLTDQTQNERALVYTIKIFQIYRVRYVPDLPYLNICTIWVSCTWHHIALN